MSATAVATMPGLLAPSPVRPRCVRAARASAQADAAFAFESFYEENIDSLVRALAATLIDSSLAADAAQEAMTRACERWATVQHHPSPAAWCYRVGTNWSTSRWRKRRREVVCPDPTNADPTNGETSGPVLAGIETHDEVLQAALLGLSVEHRAVVVLRVWMDWSVAATADALGIAPGTVQSRLHRALVNLRQIIDADGQRSGAS